MISALSRTGVQEFIASHEQADVQALLLKYPTIHDIPTAWIAAQIHGRRKAKEKLPLWYATRGIVYPSTIQLEQCSSSAVAKYRQTLGTGHSVADLCGGFGVDSFFLSHAFAYVDYVEPDQELLQIAQHNHKLLGATNIRYHQARAEYFLQASTDHFDLIFVDPSRRKENRKVVQLKDGTPNVVTLNPILLKRADQILIKSSPLLDLKQAYRELKAIDKFIVLSSENECKELLVSLKANSTSEPRIEAVDLNKEAPPIKFEFTWTDEKAATAKFSAPLTYIFEPNAAILKSGAFKLVSELYGLKKIAPSTHLYTGEKKIDDFPGRTFRVLETVALDKKLRDKFVDGYANILTRNYPLSVEEIKKKTGLGEGGKHFLICMRAQKPTTIIAERL